MPLSLRLYLDDCAYSKMLVALPREPPHQHSVALLTPSTTMRAPPAILNGCVFSGLMARRSVSWHGSGSDSLALG